MKILIIGGGSSVGQALKAAFTGFATVITAGRTNCDITLDLNDPAESMKFPEDLDVVINTAAHFGGKTDEDILAAENVNVLGALKICQAAKQAGVGHMILVSSIFASLKAGSWNYSIYALSKKHAEELSAFYCAASQLPLTILRPSQIYGSGEGFRKHQPFFYTIVDKAENGEDVNLYGSKDPRRNYIHIDDLVTIVEKVIKSKVEGNYSCASLQDITYSQVALAAYKAFNTTGRVNFLKDKADIPDSVFDKDPALYQKISFSPSISIEEGMVLLAKKRISKN